MIEYNNFEFHGFGEYNKSFAGTINEDIAKNIIDQVCHDFIHKLSIIYKENIFMPKSLLNYNIFISRFSSDVNWIYLDELKMDSDMNKYERDCIDKYISIYFPKTNPTSIKEIFGPGEFPFFKIFYNERKDNELIWMYRITR